MIDGVRLVRLDLEHVRAHLALTLEPSPAGVRIVGPNGSGKTTIMESIELLSTTRPRRGANDADLISHLETESYGFDPFARIRVRAEVEGADLDLEAFVQRASRGPGTRKLFKINQRPGRASSVVGLLPTVTFTPDDLELIIGAPAARRRFLDVLISQIDGRYLRSLSRYARVIAQRNGLLRQSTNDGAVLSDDEFGYWDEQLIALGAYLLATRVRIVAQLATTAATHFHGLSTRAGDLSVAYRSSLTMPDAWWHEVCRTSSDMEATQRVAVAYERELSAARSQDAARGVTTVGPHRDDLELQLNGRPIARYGSRGQQRLAVVAIKLGERDVAHHALGRAPLLLLDDVLAELDVGHRAALLNTAHEAGGQLFVTSTDAALLDEPHLQDLPIIVLEDAATTVRP